MLSGHYGVRDAVVSRSGSMASADAGERPGEKRPSLENAHHAPRLARLADTVTLAPLARPASKYAIKLADKSTEHAGESAGTELADRPSVPSSSVSVDQLQQGNRSWRTVFSCVPLFWPTKLVPLNHKAKKTREGVPSYI